MTNSLRLNHAFLLGNEKTIKFLESQGAVASEVINPIVSKPKEQGDADIVFLNAIINDDLPAFKNKFNLVLIFIQNCQMVVNL